MIVLYTVVVPVYNEAEDLERFLKDLRRYARNIIVVDDGSTDRTAEIAQSLGVHVFSHPCNRGKGAAVMTGLRKAKTEDVILIDGDGQFFPIEITAFVKKLKECDLVLGNRFKEGLQMPFHRLVANKLLKLLLPGINVSDPLTGFRALKRSKFLNLRENGFEHDLEMILLARRRNLKICEVPVSVTYKTGKKPSFTGLIRKISAYTRLVLYSIKRRV